MNDYEEVKFRLQPCSEVFTDILAALLAEEGYESFVADDEGMTAFIRSEQFNELTVNDIIDRFPLETKITMTHSLIEGQDWNSEWEKNYFRPIAVGDRCVIHSSFHTDVPRCQYDIVIDPKMAFGTGHHATTSLMLEQILDADLVGKKVVDMGTGTAILAILARMRGASEVIGIEIDPMAYDNALENVKLNNTGDITLINGDAASLDGIDGVDYFFANINRNIITGDIDRYAPVCRKGATMFLSGFYVEDIPVVVEAAARVGFEYQSYTERDRWACLRLVKK